MKPWIQVAERPSHPEAVGLWRIPVAERRRESPGVVQVPGVTRFLYDGETVVLFLATMKEWMYRTPDDHWRVKAEWQGDVLHYKPPFGRMTPLARFTGGRFESTVDTPPYVYESVASAAACDPEDRNLHAPRAVHDDSIKPTDPSPPR
jgi:hypothetical protein